MVLFSSALKTKGKKKKKKRKILNGKVKNLQGLLYKEEL
jgi:hypothetical protein